MKSASFVASITGHDVPGGESNNLITFSEKLSSTNLSVCAIKGTA